MELLWYGVIAAYILGMAVCFGLRQSLPSCRDCRSAAMVLSRQIEGTLPPVFDVVYRCPRCRAILAKRFVSAVSD